MTAKKIAYNIVFNSIAKILSTVLALVNIGFITRYLGREGFGDYATVLAFFSFFAAILDLGLYSVVTREISRKGADERKIISNIFTLRIVSSLVVLIICPIIIWFLPYTVEVKKGILIVAVAFIFSSAYMVLNGIFQKNLRMDKVAAAELIGKIIQVIFVWLAVKNNWGFDAIMFALLVYIVFVFIVVVGMSRKYIKVGFSFDWKYWKYFLRMSLPMGVSALVTFMYFKMDTIILSVLKGSEAVGIYNMAYKIIENITFFPAMIIGLVLPLLARHIFNNQVEFQKIANKIAKVFLVLAIPLVIGVMFLAEGIILIIGGADFLISANVLRMLVVALAFIFFGHFFNTILLSANLQKKLMKVLIICAIFNISLNFWLIPIYSYLGAATVSVLTEVLVVILTAWLTLKNVNYKFKIDNWWRILLAGGIMGLFLFVFNQKGDFIIIVVGASIVYGAALWVVRAISIEEFKSLVKG